MNMDFSTLINIAQYVLSVLVLPALWFIVKLWNNHSLLTKEVQLNKANIAEAKTLQKELADKQEEKEAIREERERSIYKAIIEMGKDVQYVKEQFKNN